MLGRGPNAGPAGGAQDHGDFGLAAEHVFHFGGLVVKLIQGHADEVHEHQFDHRPQAHGGGAHRRTHDGAFGDGGVFHPLVAELVQEPGRYAEDPAVNADILAGHVDVGVPGHFKFMGVVQRLSKRHIRHFDILLFMDRFVFYGFSPD